MVYCTDEMLEEYLEECFKEKEDEERTWIIMNKIGQNEINYLKSKIENNEVLLKSLQQQCEDEEIESFPERKKHLEENIKTLQEEIRTWNDEIQGKKEFGGYY